MNDEKLPDINEFDKEIDEAGNDIYFDKDGNEVDEILIAKILKGKQKKKREIKPIDFENLEKIDISDKKVHDKYMTKLLQGAQQLGISFVGCHKLLEVSNDIDTACWSYNVKTKEEKIMVAPHMLNYGRMNTAILLRHEVLHKSLYRNCNHLANQQMVNIVLDVCVNKILWLADGRRMHNFSRLVYPEQAKTTTVALADCSLTKDQLEELKKSSPKTGALYEELWRTKKVKGHDGKMRTIKDASIPSPASLYHRLMDLKTEKAFKELMKALENGMRLPFPIDGHNDTSQNEDGDLEGKAGRIRVNGGLKRERTKAEGKIEDKVAGQIEGKINANRDCQYDPEDTHNDSMTMGELWESNVVKPKDVQAEKLADLARQMHTRNMIDEATDSIIKHMNGEPKLQPFPKHLTRTGLMQIAVGLTDYTCMYWNKTPESAKKKATVYVDVSGSMWGFVSYIGDVVDKLLAECNLTLAGGKSNGRHSFGGSVMEMSEKEWDDMKTGKVPNGGCTSFTEVINHFLDNIDSTESDIAIIISDGESYVDEEAKQRFKDSGKSIFPVYMTEHGRGTITSDLDELCGEGKSHTIECDPVY